MCWNRLIVGSNRSKKACSLCSGWITPLSPITKIGLTSLNPQLTRKQAMSEVFEESRGVISFMFMGTKLVFITKSENTPGYERFTGTRK